MAGSLADQLLKANLISDKQLQKAKSEKKKQTKQVHKHKEIKPNQARINAQKTRQEKAAKDKALDVKKNEAAKELSIAAQISQIIEEHHLKNEDGEVAYSFVDGKAIKKIWVSLVQQKQLSKGRIAIIKTKRTYQLVPLDAAKMIEERDASRVFYTGSSESIDDDEYADYKVPDELTW